MKAVGEHSLFGHRRKIQPADDGSDLVDPARLAKFKRGPAVSTKRLQDKKLKAQLQYTDKLAKDATVSAARVDEWLLPDEAGGIETEGMERTYHYSQVAPNGRWMTACSSILLKSAGAGLHGKYHVEFLPPCIHSLAWCMCYPCQHLPPQTGGPAAAAIRSVLMHHQAERIGTAAGGSGSSRGGGGCEEAL